MNEFCFIMEKYPTIIHHCCLYECPGSFDLANSTLPPYSDDLAICNVSALSKINLDSAAQAVPL